MCLGAEPPILLTKVGGAITERLSRFYLTLFGDKTGLEDSSREGSIIFSACFWRNFLVLISNFFRHGGWRYVPCKRAPLTL